jgi:glycosyltransferase involved in cell wall biosynthesis
MVSVWGQDVIADSGESRWRKRAKTLALRGFHRVTATSKFLASRLECYLDPGVAVDVVPFGVDPTQFVPSGKIAPPVVGFVKHLYPKYSPDVLLEAFRLVRDRVPTARLLLVGSGPMEAGLKKLAGDLGVASAVEFRGGVSHEDVPNVMREIAVLAMPSRCDSETFGVAAVEAMASGVPVVATRVGGVPEVVEDGVTGLLVPVDDPGHLASALSCLLEDTNLRMRMGQAGQKRAESRYNWAHNVSQMVSIYEGLAMLSSGTRGLETKREVGAPNGDHAMCCGVER